MSQEQTVNFIIPLTKVDEEKRLIIGRAIQEVPDKSGEIIDYATAVPAFKQWSKQYEDATGGLSKGNLRVMHGKTVAGKIMDLKFDDNAKAIDVVAKVVDDNEWKKVLEGVYTGFSVGGSYLKKWEDGDLKRYTPKVTELSLVDSPCIPTAKFFELHKMDGSVSEIAFKEPDTELMKAIRETRDEVAALRKSQVPVPQTFGDLAKGVVSLARSAGLSAIAQEGARIGSQFGSRLAQSRYLRGAGRADLRAGREAGRSSMESAMLRSSAYDVKPGVYPSNGSFTPGKFRLGAEDQKTVTRAGISAGAWRVKRGRRSAGEMGERVGGVIGRSAPFALAGTAAIGVSAATQYSRDQNGRFTHKADFAGDLAKRLNQISQGAVMGNEMTFGAMFAKHLEEEKLTKGYLDVARAVGRFAGRGMGAARGFGQSVAGAYRGAEGAASRFGGRMAERSYMTGGSAKAAMGAGRFDAAYGAQRRMSQFDRIKPGFHDSKAGFIANLFSAKYGRAGENRHITNSRIRGGAMAVDRGRYDARMAGAGYGRMAFRGGLGVAGAAGAGAGYGMYRGRNDR
jgi:hypothetical protein